MSTQIAGARIVVGVGGGIAAFKAVMLVRELMRRGAEVRVAMTRSATRFVGPATFSGLTGRPPAVNLWDPSYPGELHVELGRFAQLIVVAPATANLLARAAAGMADDALLATLACAACPVLFAPAMHERMWLAAATQRNVQRLQADGALLVGPVQGQLASGQIGLGRMAEPEAIADAAVEALRASTGATAARDLQDVGVLISAGPTLEDIDPVRFISNRSSGRMGFALASAARARGARVHLVCGPTALPPPAGIETVAVRSAREMQRAVDDGYGGADVVIMTAAVADYRPEQVAREKIKKKQERMRLDLVKNPDILAELGARRGRTRHPVLVGFAMETHDLIAHARGKLRSKRCDLIVANAADVPGRDDTQAALVDARGEQALPPMTKLELANRILDRVVRLLPPRTRAQATRRSARRPRARRPALRPRDRPRSKA